MKEYKLSEDQQFYIERMRLPFAVMSALTALRPLPMRMNWKNC
jgi:hypothetical protein